MAQDNCAVTTPSPPARPTQHDDAVIAAAAQIIGVRYAKWCAEPLDQSHISSIGKMLKSCWYADGYKMARELENIDYCDPDEDLVDILGRATCDLYDAERQAVAKWVQDNEIKVSFTAGASVETPDGSGKVVNIDDMLATLCVAVPKHAKSEGYIGTIYPVEKITPSVGEAA